MKKYFIIIIFTLIFATSIFAQQDTIRQEEGYFLVDTTDNQGYAKIDSSNYKNPKIAMYLSMAMPGLGQIYNEKYWKLPIIYGLFGGGGYYIYDQNKEYQKFLDGLVLYQDLILTDIEGYTKEQLTKNKDKHRKNRDLTAFILIAFWGLNIMDAYVDAHFSTFDISDNLSMKIESTTFNSLVYEPSLGLKLSFKF